jgi:hypothetical protein
MICSSPPFGPLEKKLALDAVIGVLGVFMLPLVAGGVDGCSSSILESLKALIFAAVGVLRGSRFRGGSLAEAPFLAGFGCGFCLGSVSAWKLEIFELLLGARGVSSAFIASAKVVTRGLAEIGVSTGGRLDDLAEKNG